MGCIELHLVPKQGAKPEFLAAVQLINNNNPPPPIWDSIITNDNKVIILEGYTRDNWALDTTTNWTTLSLQSIDGRKKLPGFINYLRDRKKACFGRFVATDNNVNNNCTTYVWVISHKQTNLSQLNCRVAPINIIPKCPLRPKSSTTTSSGSQKSATAPTKPATSSTSSSKLKKKGLGLLGNLVGAQRRTNHQVVTATTTQQPSAGKTFNSNQSVEGNVNNFFAVTSHDDHQKELKTSGQVLADFRQEMEQEMLDFDIAPDVSMKVCINLSDHSKKVQEADRGKITMEVLKYIVYEQAEEVNEEWIAHKEPSEFTDEITVAIFKDADNAPPEVLEELNQAELPEEMMAQQNVMQGKRRQQELNELRIQEALQRQTLKKMATGGEGGVGASGFTVLNKDKRDLRTIEEIQQDTKRRKVE